jgi:hypothetical protein
MVRGLCDEERHNRSLKEAYTLAMVLSTFLNKGAPEVVDFCSIKFSFCLMVDQNGLRDISVGVGNVKTWVVCRKVRLVTRDSFF